MTSELAVSGGAGVKYGATENSRDYWLLPFRFARFAGDRYLLTNLVGQHILLDRESLVALVRHKLTASHESFLDLISRHFITADGAESAVELLAAKYRTRQAHLPDLTGLHIFVVTLRCTNNCRYCQVSQRSESESGFDMTAEVAELAVDFMFQSPSPYLKVEFQGGEALLNFDAVKHITEICKNRASTTNKTVDFVLCSNLAVLTREHAEYCRKQGISISTSLDGPRGLHSHNRTSSCGDSYSKVMRGISLAREYVGIDHVSALMTPTRASIGRVRDIIDEYIRCGFRSIFLRSINPYGSAVLNASEISFSVEEWIKFYHDGLEYILELNENGVEFREEFAAILLRKILTQQTAGFVDIQSPAGAGTAVMVYNYDGGIYLSDESRMLAEMGDTRFRAGTLGQCTFDELITSDEYLDLVASTMTEGVPMCSECVFQPFCGSDPVGHYRDQGDPVGHKIFSDFCKKQTAVFMLLFQKLQDPEAWPILASWV